MYHDHTSQRRADDAKTLRECGVHKLVIADAEGGCLAYLVAWGTFGYDEATDTYVCYADRDGGELMTVYTEGDIKAGPGMGMYAVTAPPDAATAPAGRLAIGAVG